MAEETSPASRGRGLKLKFDVAQTAFNHVARFTRAWIETKAVEEAIKLLPVARFTRAWIETGD